MDIRCVGGQQLGDFLGGSAILSIPSGRALGTLRATEGVHQLFGRKVGVLLTEDVECGGTGFTLLATLTAFTLRTLRALQCMDVRRVGGQQLGDFLSRSAVLSGRAGRTSGTGRTSRTSRTLLTLRNHHITAVGQENGITAHTQHLIGFILGDVAGIIVKGAYRNFGILDNGIQPCQIARMFGIEGIGNAHQLLHPFDGVVGAAFRVNFRFQEKRPHTPRDGGEFARNHITGTHLQGHQTVGVGRHLMGFHINRCALWGTDQNGDLYRNGLIGH